MNMKKLSTALIAILFITLFLPFIWKGSGLSAQNIAITDDDAYTANTSAMLDIKSITKGLLIPRLTTAQRNSISTPATGLLVFDTSLSGFYYYNGSAWINLSSGSSSGLLWSYSSPNVYLTGTSDKVGIGTSSPIHKLSVSDNVTLTDGTDGSFIDIQNQSNSTGVLSGIRFYKGTTSNTYKGGIFYKDALGFGRGDLIFANNSVNSATNVTSTDSRLTIKNSGGVEVKATTGAATNLSLFHVLNTAGDTIFAVYDGGVRINVYDDPLVKASGNKGGFAVGGFSPAKGTITNEYLKITPDSVRIYVEDASAAKASGNKGGFAVGGFSPAKAGLTNEYLRVTSDSTRVYTTDTVKGFGVKNIGATAKNGYLQLNPNNYLIGHLAGKSITGGLYNSFIGYNSGYKNTNGYKNYFIGYKSGYNNTVGFSNIFIGDSTGFTNVSGYRNVFIGNESGKSNNYGASNVFIGYNSGLTNVNGNYNVFIGEKAGYTNYDGNYNVFLGYNSGNKNTSGFNNFFGGINSGYNNTSGYYNVFLGDKAGYLNTTGYRNTAIGFNALYTNSTGKYNTSIGYIALGANTVGQGNTAVGSYAVGQSSTAWGNSGFGENSLQSTTTGGYNTAIGVNALGANITGTNNTGLGYNANVSSGAWTNSTAVGANSNVTASNQVRVGNSSVTSIGGQVGWTTLSDGRFKKNITDNVQGLDFILKLKPVTYNIDIDKYSEFLNIPDSVRINEDEKIKSQIIHTGFIAQEVEKAANDLGYDFSGVDKPKNENDYYGLRYAEFTVPLVKAVQELNEKLEVRNKKLELENSILLSKIAQIDELKTEIENLKTLIYSSSKK